MTLASFRLGRTLLVFFSVLLFNLATGQNKSKPTSDGLIKMLRNTSRLTMDDAEAYYLNEVNQILAERTLYKKGRFVRAISQRYLFLTSLYYKKADFRKADRYYNKLDSLANIEPPAITFRDAALNQRSRMMIEIGDHTEAKAIIQKNINYYENLPDKRMIMCDAYSTYGTYYNTMGQYDSSVFYYKKYILQMANNWWLPFVNDMANSYTHLADVASKNNELTDALRYARKGYRVNSHRWARKNDRAGNYYDRIMSANTVAEVYRLSGNTQKALRWNSKASNLYAQRSSQISQYELPLLTTRGLTLWSDNNMDEAQKSFDKITELYFNYINDNFSYLSEFERVYFYNTTRHYLEYAKAFYFEQLSSGNASASQKLFELTINTKGLLFNSSLKFIDKATTSSDTSIVNGYTRLKEIKNKISTVSLSKSSKPSELQALDEESKKLEKRLMDKLGIEKEKFITYTEILNNLPDQYQLVDIVKCSWIKKTPSKFKKPVLSLTDSSAYVYFASSPSRKNFEFEFTRNGKLLESSMYAAYRNSVRFNIQESKIYHEYFGKIKKMLHTKRVLYSADGIYNLINPNILYNGNAYLIDEYDFNCLVGSKEIMQQRLEHIPVNSISFFGRPDFTGHANDGVTFADLPGTEKEIDAITAIIPRAVAKQAYIGTEANENLVKTIPATTILHFATHGYFNESNFRNPLLNSGLVLSKANSNNPDIENTEDGFLTAYEASTLSLTNTSLVILSACETGLGNTVDGDGVWGLQRAFQSAGVNYIIMSLFKVDDAITAKLMTNFYNNLVSGLPVYEAFKQAESKIKEAHPEPIHWGAFILKGY
jgi:CHAT domain-containing protein